MTVWTAHQAPAAWWVQALEGAGVVSYHYRRLVWTIVRHTLSHR